MAGITTAMVMATDRLAFSGSPLITRRVGRVVFIYIALLMVPVPVTAATLEFAPEVEAGTGYTDNIRLTSDDEEDEWLAWVRPSFIFARDADRLDLSAQYALDAFLYGGTDTNLSHRFFGNANGELIRDTFFLNVSGSRTQGIVDPERSYSFGNLPRGGNRTDITQLNVMPYLQQRFGDDGIVNLSYQYGQLWYDDSEAQDSKRHLASADIGTWNKDAGFTWRANYNYTKLEYDVSQPYEYQIAYGELGFWVTRTTRLFGAYGLESDYEDVDSSGLDERSWEAGIEFVPNQRLNLLVAVGDRSWGKSYRGSLRYQVQRFTTNISYNETPTTPGLNGYRRNPFPDEDDPDDSLDRPGAGGRYINKRFNWRTTYDLAKSSWTVNLYQSKREDIILDENSELDPDDLSNEEYRGASLTWRWDAGSRTSIFLVGSFTRREFADTGDKDDIWRIRAEAEYELGPRTYVNVAYQHAEQNPDNSDSNNDSGYTANTIGFWIRRTF